MEQLNTLKESKVEVAVYCRRREKRLPVYVHVYVMLQQIDLKPNILRFFYLCILPRMLFLSILPTCTDLLCYLSWNV
jgi:hypothetical protein